jgi:hypothetical protein
MPCYSIACYDACYDAISIISKSYEWAAHEDGIKQDVTESISDQNQVITVAQRIAMASDILVDKYKNTEAPIPSHLVLSHTSSASQ